MASKLLAASVILLLTLTHLPSVSAQEQCNFYLEGTADNKSCMMPCNSNEFCDKVAHDCVSCSSVCSQAFIVRCGEVCLNRCPQQYKETIENLQGNVTSANRHIETLTEQTQKLCRKLNQSNTEELALKSNITQLKSQLDNKTADIAKKEASLAGIEAQKNVWIIISITISVGLLVTLITTLWFCCNRLSKRSAVKPDKDEESDIGSKDSLLSKEKDKKPGKKENPLNQQNIAQPVDNDVNPSYSTPQQQNRPSQEYDHPIMQDLHMTHGALTEHHCDSTSSEQT